VNEYDREQGPFELLYEQWVESGEADERDRAIAARMTAAYREAWKSGLRYEQASVLYYLFESRDQDGADLVIEGLNSDDGRVAGVAATVASVAYGLKRMQFGPELRPAFRALVRRFPENDTVRPRDLYGHLPGDEDDTRERPFVNLYEDWRADPYPRDAAICRQLVDTYRAAWANGDGVDSAFVLHFVTANGRPSNPDLAVDGRDLVIEALESDDVVLAPTAAHVADFYLSDGVHLGPGTRAALERHLRNFPTRHGPAFWALRQLDDIEYGDCVQ
jgi:hypothetical protein